MPGAPKNRARRKSLKGQFLLSLAEHRKHLRPRAPTHPDSRLWRRQRLLAVAAVAARGGGARSSQPTPSSPAANQQRLGRRNDLTGSTLLPFPHEVVGAGSQSREVLGGGRGRSSDVTFPLCHWLSGGRTTTNQQSQKVWRGPAERPVATRKRDRERTSGCIVRCSVGYARGVGRCGQVNSKILILGRRTFLIAPSHPQTWVGA